MTTFCHCDCFVVADKNLPKSPKNPIQKLPKNPIQKPHKNLL